MAVATLSSCTTPQPLHLAEFERILASEASATAALTKWCLKRGIANPPAITAQRVLSEEVPPPPTILTLLRPDAGEHIAYRHVRLVCGEAVLSMAQNWYVADRLTPEMNQVLATSDAPFGRVIAALGFTRELLASEHGHTLVCPVDTILTQRALLRLADGRPISAVIECYTSANLEDRVSIDPSALEP